MPICEVMNIILLKLQKFNLNSPVKYISQISNLAFSAASAASLAALFSSVLRYCGMRPTPVGKS